MLATPALISSIVMSLSPLNRSPEGVPARDVSAHFTDLLAGAPNAAALHAENQSVASSQRAIAKAATGAMHRLGLNPYEVHERSGVALDTVQAILEGTNDLSDSLPITLLEQTLRISLRNL